MGNIFSMDGVLARILSRLTDCITLSLLWIFCSLPLVTLGASTTALYTMTLRMVRNEEGKMAAGFFKAFKENLKNATCIHLILILLAVMLGIYWKAVGALPGSGAQAFFHGVFLLFALVWLMEAMFVWPVQARFENTVRNIMRNAWLIAAGNLHIFLMAVIVTGLPVWTLLLSTGLFIRTLPAWILAGPGLVAWLNSFLFHHCFKRYIPDEEE